MFRLYIYHTSIYIYIYIHIHILFGFPMTFVDYVFLLCFVCCYSSHRRGSQTSLRGWWSRGLNMLGVPKVFPEMRKNVPTIQTSKNQCSGDLPTKES